MAILTPPVIPKRAQTRLDALERAHPQSKPRALIVDSAGSPLLASGDVTLPVALTGVTKLFTLAMILREFERGALSPETPVIDVVPAETVEGLCVKDEQDFSDQLTVEHLLSHRSGIVDYYTPKSRKTLSLRFQSQHRDRAWSDAQALEIARHYPAHFTPGARNRVHVSNTNYLLLGIILQQSTGMTFDQLVTLRVTGPLGLKNTSVFTEQKIESYFSIAPIYLDGKPIRAPRTLASFGAAGSMVSTASDMTLFLRAFAQGELFGSRWLDYLTSSSRRLSSGILMGNGVMVARSPGRLFFGHTGSSGTAALIDQSRGLVGFLATNVWEENMNTVKSLSSLIASVRSTQPHS